MEKLTITINGKEIEMPPIKARLWKTIMNFHSARKDIPAADLVEKYCEIIAIAFGVTCDEVLDNLNLEDVGETYFKVFDVVVAVLSVKTPKKNDAPEEVATQA